MNRDCLELARDPDDPLFARALASRADALHLFLCTFPDGGPAYDPARARVLDAHPDLVGDMVRAAVPGVISWMYATGRFLAEDRLQADLEMLYVALVRSENDPDVHQEAAAVFMSLGAPPPDDATPDDEGFYDLPAPSPAFERVRRTDAYLKCMLAIAPLFPEDAAHADVWALLERVWAADDHWLAIRIVQHYVGLGMAAAPAVDDVVALADLATKYIATAPRCAVYLARLLELYQFEAAKAPADYARFAAAVARLNEAAAALDDEETPDDERYERRKTPLRSRAAAEPGFHAHKRALFSERPAEFAAEWRAHLEGVLQRAPAVPDDPAEAVRVLRAEYHVCHECMDLLPRDYLARVGELCAPSRAGRQYFRLATRRKDKVHPIEFIALDQLCARGDDHSTAPDASLYILNLARRCRRDGRLDDFRAVLTRRGLNADTFCCFYA